MIPASVAFAPRPSSQAAIIGRAAVRALYTELALSPKPGLVSPLDSGAHDDMDMTTFMRSLFALRGYFCIIAAAGASGADFADLQALGLRAERRMLAATRGINTHRGAIFSVGLLAAAAGWLRAEGRSIAGDALGRCVAHRWGAAIVQAGEQASASHGIEAVRRYGARGARDGQRWRSRRRRWGSRRRRCSAPFRVRGPRTGSRARAPDRARRPLRARWTPPSRHAAGWPPP